NSARCTANVGVDRESARGRTRSFQLGANPRDFAARGRGIGRGFIENGPTTLKSEFGPADSEPFRPSSRSEGVGSNLIVDNERFLEHRMRRSWGKQATGTTNRGFRNC